MSIRTEAIELYNGAYNKLRDLSYYGLEHIVLDNVGNVGLGFEYEGIKFGFAKASRANVLSVCPFANAELNTICIPIQPVLLEDSDFMNMEVIESLCKYMNAMNEAVLHEIIHLLDARYNGIKDEYVSVKEDEKYYNSCSEVLAYSGEIVSCIERKGQLRYFLKMLDRKESVIKFIKRELRNSINIETLVHFIDVLTEENYEWFKKYVRDEYDERMSYVC